MRDHRKLQVFQLADQLVLRVYAATRTFPREEIFGLTSQMRRSAVSVPSNIVEGCARRTDRDFNRFLDNAFGSVRELGYCIDLSTRLEFLEPRHSTELITMQSRTSGALANLIYARRT